MTDAIAAAATCAIPCWGRNDTIRAYALVDPEDFADLEGHRWSLAKVGYPQRAVKLPGHAWTHVYLHRQIMGLERGDPRQVDHINGDKLDNRRSNLRIVTQAQNKQNLPSFGGASKYRGVYLDRSSGRWYGQVRVNGKTHCTPRRATEEEVHTDISSLRVRLLSHTNEARSGTACSD